MINSVYLDLYEFIIFLNNIKPHRFQSSVALVHLTSACGQHRLLENGVSEAVENRVLCTMRMSEKQCKPKHCQ